MISEFNSLRLSNITKIILLILSVILLILILFLMNFYLNEKNDYTSKIEISEIYKTNKKFQEKIKNIEILLNILGRVIVENNYKSPQKINSVFSKYIDYYENHLDIATKNDNPLLIQYLYNNSNIKIDRFSGIEKYNQNSNNYDDLMKNAKNNSWKIIFDNTNKFLLKNDYIFSIAFGIKNKNKDFPGMFLVHLNKDHLNNFINYPGNIFVFDEKCNLLFVNNAIELTNQQHQIDCHNNNYNKESNQINKIINNNSTNSYNVNYKDLIFLFEPSKFIFYSFFSIVKNNLYLFLVIILVLVITLFTSIILYALHLKIRKQEKLFDYYTSDHNLNINEFLEKIKDLNYLIESDKELTNELKIISNLIPVLSQNISSNIYNIVNTSKKLLEYCKPNVVEVKDLKNLYHQVIKIEYKKSLYKNYNNVNIYQKSSQLPIKSLFQDFNKDLKNHKIHCKFLKNCFISDLKILGNSNLIKTMLIELISKFYETCDVNFVTINTQDDLKLKKAAITLEGNLNLDELDKAVLRIDFPKTTIINDILLSSKGLLFAKFIIKIHNGILKVKKTNNKVLIKLLFNKI